MLQYSVLRDITNNLKTLQWFENIVWNSIVIIKNMFIILIDQEHRIIVTYIIVIHRVLHFNELHPFEIFEICFMLAAV